MSLIPLKTPLLVLAPLALPLALAAAGTTSADPAGAEEPRVVLLGFDGADARTIEELIQARPGEYPTFERLAREGTFGRLLPVAPPESPVSWAALNTGQNPAKTGVPGFVKRELEPSPRAWFGHITQESKPLAAFENTPIPDWSAPKLGAVAGGTAFVVFLLIFAVLLRLNAVLSALLSLVLGGVGGWCGYTVRGLLAEQYPRTGNPLQARNFWDHLADAGVETIVLDAAQAFDMPTGARMLAGLGVPDAKGALGDWCVYTEKEGVFKEAIDGGEATPTAGTLFKVFVRDGRVESRLQGPKNFWLEQKLKDQIARIDAEYDDPQLDYQASLKLGEAKEEARARLEAAQKEGTWLPLVAELDLGARSARIALGGEEQTVLEGEWSDFYHLSFELNWLLKVHAITRVKLISLEPFELYVNVLDIDPEKPPFWQAISTPFAFSAELAKENGPYETYGWPTATMPLKDEVVDPELLMEDVEFTMGWRERLTYSQLARDDWRVLMSVFSTTDRVQHMMYKYYDEGHPQHDPAEAAKTLTFFGEEITRKDAIPAIYRQMDRILGTVLEEHLGPDDVLLVCSDHGFQSFRRQVHVNNFLAEKGYLKLRTPLTTGRDLAYVDWEQTQAYSLGLGFIYLNLKGREPRGIVDPAEADALLARIKADLLAYEDPETGLRICKEVYVTRDVHSGPFLDLESDLICGFAPTYRVSWGTTMGGLELAKDEGGANVLGPVCIDSDKTWSGDHVSVATSEVAGAFFSNRRIEVPEGGFNALHVAPTALALVGVAVPPEMDEEPLDVSGRP